MEDRRYINKFYLLAYILFGLGVVVGGIYYAKHCFGAEYIKNYLDSFSAAAAAGSDKGSVALRAIKSNSVMFCVLLCGVVFKPGLILIPAVILRQGFVSGFTAAAFIAGYGGTGILMSVSLLPGILLLVPSAMLFSAVNASVALKKTPREKNFLILYIFFAFVIFTIFCAAGFLEGYLSTIFMEIIFSTAS